MEPEKLLFSPEPSDPKPRVSFGILPPILTVLNRDYSTPYDSPHKVTIRWNIPT